jgi:hypothetical protein
MTPISRTLLPAGLLLASAACRVEQRPPAGPAREQFAVQGAVAAYYDRLARGDRDVPADPSLAGDSIALVRSDVQLQRDLASVFAGVRVRAPGAAPEPRVQHLLLRRRGADWVVIQVATAVP